MHDPPPHSLCGSPGRNHSAAALHDGRRCSSPGRARSILLPSRPLQSTDHVTCSRMHYMLESIPAPRTSIISPQQRRLPLMIPRYDPNHECGPFPGRAHLLHRDLSWNTPASAHFLPPTARRHIPLHTARRRHHRDHRHLHAAAPGAARNPIPASSVSYVKARLVCLRRCIVPSLPDATPVYLS